MIAAIVMVTRKGAPLQYTMALQVVPGAVI